ncbi:CLUMA_CG015637, isoform A [Clunio marinus]|uniref:CLUMA_CG015637, isoform A n=1 Tax=Clunio marinus TaxID=568069 RepID=A0A1J1INV0_9DIPT|nr:CLUMA_CG015637, isoform A [Clunio marinus]
MRFKCCTNLNLTFEGLLQSKALRSCKNSFSKILYCLERRVIPIYFKANDEFENYYNWSMTSFSIFPNINLREIKITNVHEEVSVQLYSIL